MNPQKEYERGKNNAHSREDWYGVKAAREWLEKRQADLTRDPLSPFYVKGYLDYLDSIKA